MLDQIKAIINGFYQSCGETSDIPAAAQAIVDLVESQPVDRVRAMALFVSKTNLIGGTPGHPDLYRVPDARGRLYEVEVYPDQINCWRKGRGACQDDPCDHVRAVKLCLENQK